MFSSKELSALINAADAGEPTYLLPVGLRLLRLFIMS